MRIIEAIERANEFVHQNTGVECDPSFVRLIDEPGQRRTWWVAYKAALFFPREVEAGAVIDDGDYVVSVDDETCQVSVVN